MHPSLSRLHQLRPTDPLVRWLVDPDKDDLSLGDRLVNDGSNVAWRGRATRPGENWVTGLGEDPARVAALVVGLAETGQVDGVTVPDAVFRVLPEALRSPDPGHWCLWTRPADLPVEAADVAGAVDLALDDPRIAPLLAHSTSAHLFPGNPRIVRWAGVCDGDRLVAVAGQVREKSGAAHLVSVCTDPDYRGRGLAGMACSRVMDAAMAEGAPMLVLEMYVDNPAGRRAYERLGFTEVGRYYSGLLAHALAAVAAEAGEGT